MKASFMGLLNKQAERIISHILPDLAGDVLRRRIVLRRIISVSKGGRVDIDRIEVHRFQIFQHRFDALDVIGLAAVIQNR